MNLQFTFNDRGETEFQDGDKRVAPADVTEGPPPLQQASLIQWGEETVKLKEWREAQRPSPARPEA